MLIDDLSNAFGPFDPNPGALPQTVPLGWLSIEPEGRPTIEPDELIAAWTSEEFHFVQSGTHDVDRQSSSTTDYLSVCVTYLL